MSRSAADGEQIGKQVRRLRKERDLTQLQLADQVGCSRSLVQQIENGTRIPPLALRERLSSVLGERLPTTGNETEADVANSDLRMRFNILLGKDPAAVERVLAIAQSLVDASAAREEVAPLRDIAERQLERAEEVLTQIPSGSATVWEWNTINDWLTVLSRASRAICAIHTADLGTIGGDLGDEYHSAILRLAAGGIVVRRLYVLDEIADVVAYEDKIWQQVKAGVETVLVNRLHASNAQSMLIVDESYVTTGEYDYARRERVATRFSALKHDVRFAQSRFDKLYALTGGGLALVVNEVMAQPALARFQRLGEADCRPLFRAALAQAWNDGMVDSAEGAPR
ncbi:helix-turn-helix transcriptional regulator [Nocardia sp. NBC_01327]|uniref:helix-turn-helix transcriptional regulator n=1 Tax=Nocardia sp. NBC_01327 TaxID=2903593 RepID=UPI002E10EB14|nr:helix-turn-helix domain-containing protein [Nocardia sp. NBC_01327]